jgi:hypothetical protein
MTGLSSEPRYYSKKFNARRAAEAAHVDFGEVRFFKVDGQGWTWAPIEQPVADQPADEFPGTVDGNFDDQPETDSPLADVCPADNTVADQPAADKYPGVVIYSPPADRPAPIKLRNVIRYRA